MKKVMVVVGLVASLILPVVSHGGTAWSPSDLRMSGNETGGKMVVASDQDQPCYAGGKYAGNCSPLPYLNVLNSTCYATLESCKKAEGDLSNTPGSGSCVRCGR